MPARFGRWRRALAQRRAGIEPGQTLEIPRGIGRSSTKVGRWVVLRMVDLRQDPHVEIGQSHGDVRKVLSVHSVWSTYKARVVAPN
jgi:hypothetical protein